MTETTDPRVEAVAEALRDREDGSTGWRNTTAHHQNFLRMEAARLLIVADAADPWRHPPPHHSLNWSEADND